MLSLPCQLTSFENSFIANDYLSNMNGMQTFFFSPLNVVNHNFLICNYFHYPLMNTYMRPLVGLKKKQADKKNEESLSFLLILAFLLTSFFSFPFLRTSLMSAF